MNNIELAPETVIRDDLGVLFQDDLKLAEHIHNMTAAANSKLGVIRNTFFELNKENFIVLYKAYVRPLL